MIRARIQSGKGKRETLWFPELQPATQAYYPCGGYVGNLSMSSFIRRLAGSSPL